VLAGGGFSTQVRTLYKEIDSPAQIAHTCAALRIEAFMPIIEFRQRMDEIIDLMHSCPMAPGVERVFVPGEIEYEMERRRRTEGIPINAELREELITLGKDLGVTAPW
jgi:LDH2 family malate/lactate/ureidoglycolate dehydrogenase